MVAVKAKVMMNVDIRIFAGRRFRRRRKVVGRMKEIVCWAT